MSFAGSSVLFDDPLAFDPVRFFILLDKFLSPASLCFFFFFFFFFLLFDVGMSESTKENTN